MKEESLTVEKIIGAPYDDFHAFSGGMQENPTWDEYIDMFLDQWHPHLNALKKFIEDNGMIGTTGEQTNEVTFKFSDGTHWGFTWRAWGDLMQAIVGKREGYMKYYM